MKIYYASIRGCLKHCSKSRAIRRAIVQANTKAEATRKFIDKEGIDWVNRVLDENPNMSICVWEIEDDVYRLGC